MTKINVCKKIFSVIKNQTNLLKHMLISLIFNKLQHLHSHLKSNH